MKSLNTLLFVLLSSLYVFAQNMTFEGMQSQGLKKVNTNPTLEKTFKQYSLFQLSTEEIYSFLESSELNRIPGINDEIQFNLGLEKSDSYSMSVEPTKVFSDDYQLLGTHTKNGNWQRPLTFAGTTDYGKVTLTVSSEGLIMEVKTADEQYFLQPLKKYVLSASSDQYIYFKESDLKHKHGHCGIDTHTELHELQEELEHYKEVQKMSSATGCLDVRIALGAVSNMRNKYGSTSAVESYLASVINNVNTDYDDSFDKKIKFQIVSTYVASNSSDALDQAITSTTNSGTILTNFRNWANAGNLSSNAYDIGMLFSTTNFQNSVVGLAWVDALCKETNRYCLISDWTGSTSQMRQTVTHEIGHLFGCVHTTGIMAPSISNPGSSTWDSEALNKINTKVKSIKCNFGNGQLNGSTNALFNIPNVVCKNETFSTRAVNSRNTTSYNWSAPSASNSSSSQQIFTTSYATTGNKSITLTTDNGYACDGSNVPSTSTKSLTVVNQEGAATPTCTTDYTSNAGQDVDVNLSPTNVSFGSVNRTSPYTFQDQLIYENLTCQFYSSHQGGETVNFSITSGTSYDIYTKVWIDYNNDGTFNDTNEKVVDIDKNKNGTNTASVVLPTSGVVPNRILKVRVITDVNVIGNACAKPTYGQTEDYGIIITIPTCDDGIQNGDETGIDCGGSSCEPCVCSSGDSDDDGVCDLVDLDDDNDGIFDEVECAGSKVQANFSNGNGGGTHTYTRAYTDSIVVNFNTLDNSARVFINNNPIDKVFQLERYGYNSNTEVFLKFSDGDYYAPWVANSNGLPRLKVVIDKAGKVTLFGTKSFNSTQLTPVIRETNVPLATVNYGNSTTLKVVNQDQNGPDGMTGNILMLGKCDTDGDGVFNSVDLDSDNDGCVDALEGGKTIAINQLVMASTKLSVGSGSTAARKNLGVTVDANGVPQIVSGGQSAGTAYNANVQQSDCNEPDTEAPTTPNSLVASNITYNSFTVSWNASSDNIGVTGYRVYKDGTLHSTVTGLSTNLTGLNAQTSYNIKVSAIDAAGNESVHTPEITVTTLAAPSCVNTKVEIRIDNYGYETSWTLKNSAGVTVMQGSNYAANSTNTVEECLPAGCYTFKIVDDYGDGICCSYGNGYYKVFSNGTLLTQGGNFGSSETKQVCNNNASGEESETRSLESTNYRVYPNPATDYIRIAGAGNANYAVYSIHGKQLLNGQLQGDQIDIKTLSPGIYYVKIKDARKGYTTLTFVKK